MSHIFNKPPLIEALCQFQFIPAADRPLDSTVPGLMYARIRGEYPTIKEQPGLQMDFALDGTATPQLSPMTSRVLFERKDGKVFVQIAPNFLAINHLLPYPGWEQFEEIIFSHLDLYQEIAKPQAISHMELRYINRLEIPREVSGPSLNIPDFCAAYPQVPESLVRSGLVKFVQRVEIEVAEASGTLVIQSGDTAATQSDHIGILLDLSFVQFSDTQVALKTASAWIKQAHEEVERAFLACIAPKARECFEEKHHD